MPEEASTTPEKKEKDYHQYLVQLKEMLPILSVILVFLGYWNLDSYYDYFGIDIYNYVTVSEILLSFLPVMKVVIIVILIIIVFLSIIAFIIVTLSEFETQKKEEGNVNDEELLPFDIVANIKVVKRIIETVKMLIKNKRNLSTKAILWGWVMIVAYLSFLILSIWLYTRVYNGYEYFLKILFDMPFLVKEAENAIVYLLGYALLVSLIIYYSLLVRLNGILGVIARKSRYIILGIFLSTLILSISNQLKAGRILIAETLNKNTSILINNKTINTDSNLVYIGQTQNYIFLRKLKEETNVIYKMSDIDKLEIEGKKIK